jgi:hypothetical protein
MSVLDPIRNGEVAAFENPAIEQFKIDFAGGYKHFAPSGAKRPRKGVPKS